MKASTLRFARRGTALPLLLATALATGGVRLVAQDPMADCPMHAQHTAHTGPGPELDARGEQVMGFDHTRTQHHFLLAPDGGSIDVTAIDAADATSRDAIRKHLRQVAEVFKSGDFEMPGAIHARTLPGVETMQRLKGEIRYRYEETERGGQVRIASANPEARRAIHDFLRAQIEDHRTGDPMAVPER